MRVVANIILVAVVLARVNGAEARVERARVSIWLTEAPGVETRLRGSTQDLFGEIGVHPEWIARERITSALVLPNAPTGPDSIAIFVDLEGNQTTLYFASNTRVAIRALALRDGLDDLASEQIAHIMVDSVDGLLRGVPLGVSHAEAAEVLAPTPPPSPALRDSAPVVELTPMSDRRRFDARARAFYGVEAWGSRTVAQGPGVAISFGAQRSRVRFGVEGTGQFRIPLTHAFDLAELRIQGGSVGLLGTVGIAIGARGFFSLAAGANLDLMRLRPRDAAGDHVQLADARWVIDPEARVRVSFSFEPTRNFNFGASVGVDVGLVDSRYTTVLDGVEQPGLDPWPVRPLGELYIGAAL